MEMSSEVTLFDSFHAVHFLSIIVFSIVVYFVWRTTDVPDSILDNRIPVISAFVRRSSSSNATEESESPRDPESDLLTNSVENITDSIFNEASASFNENSNNFPIIDDRAEIIQAMDSDLPTTSTTLRHRSNVAVQSADTIAPCDVNSEGNEMTIKLKYLNDDVKVVNCLKNESIGDFKKRNFSTELETKLVKLVFNGKVLTDTATLRDAGVFNSAVIHVLIHNMPINRLTDANQNNNENNVPIPSPNGVNVIPESSSLFIYFVGMALVSVTLLLCWYCRLQYSNYFSWYSTVGLVLMTSLFILLVPLIILVMHFSNR